MVFVSIFSSEENQLQIGKKWKNFFVTLFAKKIQSEKNFEITFGRKRSLQKLGKINKTMNSIFGLGHEIYDLK